MDGKESSILRFFAPHRPSPPVETGPDTFLRAAQLTAHPTRQHTPPATAMLSSKQVVAGQQSMGSMKGMAAPRAAAPRATRKQAVVMPLIARHVAAVEAMGAARRCVVLRASAPQGAPTVAPKQEKASTPMNIVVVATEVAPWSKTGASERSGGAGR